MPFDLNSAEFKRIKQELDALVNSGRSFAEVLSDANEEMNSYAAKSYSKRLNEIAEKYDKLEQSNKGFFAKLSYLWDTGTAKVEAFNQKYFSWFKLGFDSVLSGVSAVISGVNSLAAAGSKTAQGVQSSFGEAAKALADAADSGGLLTHALNLVGGAAQLVGGLITAIDTGTRFAGQTFLNMGRIAGEALGIVSAGAVEAAEKVEELAEAEAKREEQRQRIKGAGDSVEEFLKQLKQNRENAADNKRINAIADIKELQKFIQDSERELKDLAARDLYFKFDGKTLTDDVVRLKRQIEVANEAMDSLVQKKGQEAEKARMAEVEKRIRAQKANDKVQREFAEQLGSLETKQADERHRKALQAATDEDLLLSKRQEAIRKIQQLVLARKHLEENEQGQLVASKALIKLREQLAAIDDRIMSAGEDRARLNKEQADREAEVDRKRLREKEEAYRKELDLRKRFIESSKQLDQDGKQGSLVDQIRSQFTLQQKLQAAMQQRMQAARDETAKSARSTGKVDQNGAVIKQDDMSPREFQAAKRRYLRELQEAESRARQGFMRDFRIGNITGEELERATTGLTDNVTRHLAEQGKMGNLMAQAVVDLAKEAGARAEEQAALNDQLQEAVRSVRFLLGRGPNDHRRGAMQGVR